MENYTNIPVYNSRFTGILLENACICVVFPLSGLLDKENSEGSGAAM